MFRYFNSNWLIPDEIELTSMFVGVASVTLQIIPSRKDKKKKNQIFHTILIHQNLCFIGDGPRLCLGYISNQNYLLFHLYRALSANASPNHQSWPGHGLSLAEYF